jgi:DHA2 family multidrug resistance protein
VIANLLMLTLGFTLFGSTVLIPQLVQTLFGYTATDAGLVISPGGFVMLLALPVVGRLVGTVDLRILITIGLLASAAALYHLSGFSLDADYDAFMWARIYQTVGLAFLFIPINTVAFVAWRTTRAAPPPRSSTCRATSAAASASPWSRPCSRGSRRGIRATSWDT